MDSGDVKHLKQKLLKLEKENALLKVRIAKMASNEVSLTASDVSNQTTPRIAKPPNYNEQDSEEDDDFDEPRPPPDENALITEDQTEREPAKQSNANGNESEDEIMVNNIVHLGSDTVHDGDGKKISESGKKINDEGEADGGEEMERQGEYEGEEEKGVAKEDEKSRDQNSWVVVNKQGEKGKDASDGSYDADNVTELVDRVESALEAISKDVPGAFDDLVATLHAFLPLTLFMADEVKMLRENKKDLIRRIRALTRENQQVRLDAEQRVFVVETKSVATSPEQDASEEKRKEEKSEEAEDKQLVIETLKKEGKKLRMQVKELQHVNLSWEKYSHKKTSRYEAETRKMKTKLAATEEKNRKLEKRLSDKFRQYDTTLMDVKRSEERQKLIGAEYKKERDAYQMKYEEMKRQLKEQDEEIKRLNEVIARKDTPKVYMKPAAFVVTQQARVVDDKHRTAAAPAARRKPDHRQKQDAAIAAALAAAAGASPSDRDKGKTKDAKQQKTKPSSPPLSPRGPPGYMNDNNPMSLTREELKDQVVLYKEQIDVYRADFNQERRDREKAVGQVDSLKKELEKTKKKVKEMQRQRMQEEHDLYAAGRLEGRMRYLPEDTQEMRLREIKEQARGKGKYSAYGRQIGEANLDMLEADLDLPEEHLYADIN